MKPARILKAHKKQVLDKWAYLSACDRCRTKKVKCVRLDPVIKDCKACQHRNKSCYNTELTWSSSSSAPAASTSRNIDRPVSKDSPIVAAPMNQTEAAVLSGFSTESRLQRIELSQSFMSELLASFFQHSDEQAPYANYEKLRMDFEYAGRRLNQLQPMAEVMVLAMIASSAQFSDSDMLLGSHSPRLQHLTSAQYSQHLQRFGFQRQALCEHLAQRVLDLADARGLYRKASPLSISVLMMLPRIFRHPAPLRWQVLSDVEDIWRTSVSTALVHIRTLFARHGPSNVDIGEIQWMLIIGDACHSAIHGCNLLVNDEDLLDFPYMSGIPHPSADISRRYLVSNIPGEFLLPLVTVANEIVRVARCVAKTVSIPILKRRSIDLETFSEQIKAVRNCLKLLRECQNVAEEVEPFIHPATLELQKLKFGATMPTCLKLAPLSPALLMPALHKQFLQYEQHYNSAMLFNESDGMQHTERVLVRQQLNHGLTEAILVVSDAIESLEGKEKVASLTRQTSLMVPIQQTLSMYFNLALNIAAIEENGVVVSWTHATKLRTLRVLVDALHLQTWAWSDREVEAAECELHYNHYVASICQQTYRPLSRAAMDTPDNLTSTTQSEFCSIMDPMFGSTSSKGIEGSGWDMAEGELER